MGNVPNDCSTCQYLSSEWAEMCGECTMDNSNYEQFTSIKDSYDQTIKTDAGKPKLTLVPQQIIYDVAEVREYGVEKYHAPDNWKLVEKERYRDAMFRHMLAYLKDPKGVDAESGIEHLKHLACNVAFLCELEAQHD